MVQQVLTVPGLIPGVAGGVLPGNPAKNQDIEQRVAHQSVLTVNATTDLASQENPGDIPRLQKKVS